MTKKADSPRSQSMLEKAWHPIFQPLRQCYFPLSIVLHLSQNVNILLKWHFLMLAISKAQIVLIEHLEILYQLDNFHKLETGQKLLSAY